MRGILSFGLSHIFWSSGIYFVLRMEQFDQKKVGGTVAAVFGHKLFEESDAKSKRIELSNDSKTPWLNGRGHLGCVHICDTYLG